MPENKNKIIKAIVFDFGGVIELDEGEKVSKLVAELLGISLPEFLAVYFKYNHLSNVENTSWEDMVVKVASEFNKSPETENRVRKIIQDSFAKKKINTELISFFPILKNMGLKVAVLSNATSELRKRLLEKGIADLVDEIIISGEIGFQKPHKEAFDVLFEKLGLKPEEVVFVDDSHKSLEKAGEIGYVPILFRNNEQLLDELKNQGISLF